MNKIKYGKALAFGFSEFFNNFSLYFKIGLRYFLISLGSIFILFLSILPFIASKSNNIVNVILLLIPFIIYTFIQLILWELLTYEILQYGFEIPIDSHSVLLAVFKNKQMKDFIIARLSYYVRLAIGFCLFIIPGLYIFSKYLFSGYSIVQNNNSIKDDKQINAYISKGRLMNFFFWGIITNFLMSVLSIFAWFIAPPFILANAHAYKQISQENK